MVRRAARVDDNQAALVGELRAMGVMVQHLHMVGHGCPDILCGYRGRNYLFEIKDGAKQPSARKLTPQEKSWHRLWRGQVSVICTAEEAMTAMLEPRVVPIKGEIS